MKTSYIIGLVVIGIAISIIVTTAGDASSYVSFKEAIELAKDGDDTKVHVVGKLSKSTNGEIIGMVYAPQLDPNYFEFQLIDQKNEVKKVIYSNPKPQDFERSEQVVIIGSMKNDVFVCDKILMKCPSKYQETEIKS
ncbi:MAG: cytochrome c maturation protein CcmE [Cytophagales bacterium]|nr:MAG: cytochrome c maturation protein CcmE [Cytophagales bacterium]